MTNDTIDTTIGGIDPLYPGAGSGGWAALTARLSSEGRKWEGISVVTTRVLVDSNGCPLHWEEPTTRRIEPRSRTENLRDLIMRMTLDERENLLRMLAE